MDAGTGGGPGGGLGGGSTAGGAGGSMGAPSTVTLSQACTAASGSLQCSYVASANFGGSSPSCTTSTVAGCEVTDCVAGDGGVIQPVVSKPAGTVSFGGTHVTDGGLTLPYGDGGYATLSGFGRLFDALAVLTVSATGDIVPGFGMQPLGAPADATLTAPHCAGQLCDMANILEPFPITWTGGGGADLVVTFTSVSQLEARSAVCRLNSSPSSIDSQVLLRLGPDADGYITTFQASTAATNTFSDGSYLVSFTALTASDGSSGRINLSD